MSIYTCVPKAVPRAPPSFARSYVQCRGLVHPDQHPRRVKIRTSIPRQRASGAGTPIYTLPSASLSRLGGRTNAYADNRRIYGPPSPTLSSFKHQCNGRKDRGRRAPPRGVHKLGANREGFPASERVQRERRPASGGRRASSLEVLVVLEQLVDLALVPVVLAGGPRLARHHLVVLELGLQLALPILLCGAETGCFVSLSFSFAVSLAARRAGEGVGWGRGLSRDRRDLPN